MVLVIGTYGVDTYGTRLLLAYILLELFEQTYVEVILSGADTNPHPGDKYATQAPQGSYQRFA